MAAIVPTAERSVQEVKPSRHNSGQREHEEVLCT